MTVPESTVATQVRAALARRLKRDESRIHPRDDLREDLGLDSLDLIELVFKMEEAFHIDIPNADLAGLRTVGDAITYVEGRLEPPGGARRASKVTAGGPRTAARSAVKRPAAGRKSPRT